MNPLDIIGLIASLLSIGEFTRKLITYLVDLLNKKNLFFGGLKWEIS
jgi:hypothetical protein